MVSVVWIMWFVITVVGTVLSSWIIVVVVVIDIIAITIVV